MSRSTILRTSPRLFFSPPLCPPRLPRRPFSSASSTKHQNLNSSNTFRDRAIVLGLLTLTASVGVAIGTRAKCQQENKSKIQNIRTSELEKSSTKPNNQAESTAEKATENEADTSAGKENSEQGAFNPETGEINWDCPCLGGMAHGTCGEHFKAAFSCFVYSEQEPKGVECIDKFKGMQDCFREHPDEYGPELTDSEDSAQDDDSRTPPDETNSEEDSLQPTETEERQLAARPITTHPSDSRLQRDVEETPSNIANSNSSSSSFMFFKEGESLPYSSGCSLKQSCMPLNLSMHSTPLGSCSL